MSENRHLLNAFNRLDEVVEKLSANINQKIDLLMSQITDFAAATQTTLDRTSADLDLIKTGIANLNAEIQALQNSPGALSPADQAALDSISTNSAALATKADAVVPPTLPPVPPAPAAPTKP